MLRGAIAILFGVIALTSPGAALFSLAFLFGIYLLADGIIGVVGTVRAVGAHRHWGALLAEGAVMNILMGLIALLIQARRAGLRAVDGWLGPGLRRADDLCRAASAYQPWALVAGDRRRGFAGLGGHAGGCTHDWRGGADLVGLGIYAIVFGIALLACGWQLRGRKAA